VTGLVGWDGTLSWRPQPDCEPATWRAFLTPFIMLYAARI
jgi:hypothetical protein